MQRCDDTITVFNAKLDRDSGNDVYFPTVISGVSWFFNAITTVDSSGLKAANQLTLRVPVDADFSGKTYLRPEEFAVTDAPNLAFTFKAGDIVVHARVDDAGLRPSDLKAAGYEMATILAVTDNHRAAHAPHWKAIGK